MAASDGRRGAGDLAADVAGARAAAPASAQDAASGTAAGEHAVAPASTPSTSLQKRVFWALTGIAVVATLVAALAATFVFQSSLVTDAHGQLARECGVVGSVLNDSADPVGALAGMDFGDERATLVRSDGTVLYDSQADAADLPNHLSRPEIADAVAGGEGSSERESETVGYVSIYQALRLQDGSVLRLSEDRAGVLALLNSTFGVLVIVLVALVVASWFVSRALSRWLIRPVLEMDPTGPDARSPYRELQPLVTRLGEQQAQLERQMEQLRDVDVMRQEFTANVTHELKTPIASISGAAELIRDGIARPEDVQGFAGRIYGDARRLSSLVSDILTLSKLDESERSRDMALFGAASPCDLLSVARDVADRLKEKARQAHVELSVDGESVQVEGYPRLLDELVGNLVDNAIRYNVEGGSVDVAVGRDGGHPFVRVADTGVGIPPEAQDKVFERFYRVDKSRSRASGGTGLGLAIVKHAAKVHGADVRLESEPGRGTTITVTFGQGPGKDALPSH